MNKNESDRVRKAMKIYKTFPWPESPLNNPFPWRKIHELLKPARVEMWEEDPKKKPS